MLFQLFTNRLIHKIEILYMNHLGEGSFYNIFFFVQLIKICVLICVCKILHIPNIIIKNTRHSGIYMLVLQVKRIKCMPHIHH